MDANAKLTLLLLDARLTVNSTEGPVSATVYLNAALLGLFGTVLLAAAKKSSSFALLLLVHQVIERMRIANVCLSSALPLLVNKAIKRMRIADVFLFVEARLVLLLRLSATMTPANALVPT